MWLDDMLRERFKIFDPHGGSLLKRLQEDTKSTELPITSIVKWRPMEDSEETDHILLAGDNDGHITKFDVSDGMMVDQIKHSGEENKIHAMDYSSNGRQFAAAGMDKLVRIYDDVTMKLVQTSDPFKSGHAGHSNRIFSVKFKPDDPNILISGGWDNNIIIHDMRCKGPVNSIIDVNV